jgi:hypothetical protein
LAPPPAPPGLPPPLVPPPLGRRALVRRERAEDVPARVPRLREDFARVAAGFFAAVDFFAALLRVAPAVEDFARDEVDFFAAERLAAGRLAVDRLAVERLAGLRAPPPRLEPDDPELELALASIDHLPDITRWAASATASAISEPSLVALATTLLAAWLAVSAASRPASRIALRAFGLALIAAAAAAKPAASISLLIAALASLSTVSLPLLVEDALLEEDREELLRADLAIALFLRSRKDTSRL